jgi:hypothetical protein
MSLYHDLSLSLSRSAPIGGRIIRALHLTGIAPSGHRSFRSSFISGDVRFGHRSTRASYMSGVVHVGHCTCRAFHIGHCTIQVWPCRPLLPLASDGSICHQLPPSCCLYKARVSTLATVVFYLAQSRIICIRSSSVYIHPGLCGSIPRHSS